MNIQENNKTNKKQRIIIKGEDRTNDIYSIDVKDNGNKYKIQYYSSSKKYTYKAIDVQFYENCLASERNATLFQYFTQLAYTLSLKTESGNNILGNQYSAIQSVDENTVLARYFNPEIPIEKQQPSDLLLFAFGMNQSQKKAVENAFSSPVSIIPWSTGDRKNTNHLEYHCKCSTYRENRCHRVSK